MTEDQKAKFKFSCKKTNGYSMNMDGTIRSAEHAGVIVAALDGQYADNHNLLNAAPELLEALAAFVRLQDEKIANPEMVWSTWETPLLIEARAAIAKAERAK